MSAADRPGPTLREARRDDYERLDEFEVEIGFRETNRDYWRLLWDNPVMERDSRLACGWILEEAGKIVGYWGNIPMAHAFGDRDLIAGVAKGVAITASLRGTGQIGRLATCYFEQPGAQLTLSTTTNTIAGKMFHKYGARYIPQEDYHRALFWITNPSGFVASTLRKKGVPGALATIGGVVGAPLAHADRLLRGRGPARGRGAAGIVRIDLDEVGEEFDALWAHKRAERPRLMADRSSRLIRWHFDQPAGRAAVRIAGYREQGRLRGYVILSREPVRKIGLVRFRTADLVAENDDPAVIDRLLLAAYDWAREDGAHMLEMVGFPDAIRDRVRAGAAHERWLPHRPYVYSTIDPALDEPLSDPACWYACPFDGDDTLRGAP